MKRYSIFFAILMSLFVSISFFFGKDLMANSGQSPLCQIGVTFIGNCSIAGSNDVLPENDPDAFFGVWYIEDSIFRLQPFEFPIIKNMGLEYDFIIDWGDGTISKVTSEDDPDLEHMYSAPYRNQDVTIKVSGTMEGFANKHSGHNDKLKRVSLGDTGLKNLKDAFSNNGKLSGVDMGNTSEVVDFSGAFFRTNNLRSIGYFDTSSAVNMSGMFAMAQIETLPLLDASNVENMEAMFIYNTRMRGDISSWDVSSVTNCGRFAFGTSSEWGIDNKPQFTNCTP